MCLGVPGKIVQIDENSLGMTMGRVSFGGVLKEVCLAYVPEAQVGDYVVVHVGFAISQVDEAEAQEVFKFLAEMEELAELEIPQPADPVTVSANGHAP
jgi:hydrogenase expression/formation protein HypC